VWKVKKDELDGNVMERSCKGNPLTCSVAWLAGRDHAIFYTNVTQPKYGSFHFFLFFFLPNPKYGRSCHLTFGFPKAEPLIDQDE
jgi:hypothetical protein